MIGRLLMTYLTKRHLVEQHHNTIHIVFESITRLPSSLLHPLHYHHIRDVSYHHISPTTNARYQLFTCTATSFPPPHPSLPQTTKHYQLMPPHGSLDWRIDTARKDTTTSPSLYQYHHPITILHYHYHHVYYVHPQAYSTNILYGIQYLLPSITSY